jgi:hypothetical protein
MTKTSENSRNKYASRSEYSFGNKIKVTRLITAQALVSLYERLADLIDLRGGRLIFQLVYIVYELAVRCKSSCRHHGSFDPGIVEYVTKQAPE